ncbi:MAG: flagellar biosynthesis protein FlhG [Clostridia bacterium]|jgi:flagellar biosynthesis protein FlhG|nr:flagellar biosynthesis protein FlhG [Clostridia bacterium]MDN5322951.1 flagellar biosynthesis protein FlhG [Clostridia bacterium]
MNTQLDRLKALTKNLKIKAEGELNGKEYPTKVITIASGKGGVGKTNFTLNLGLALAELGQRVLILDADLGLANIDVILGISPRFNLFHVINGEKELSEIIIEGPNGIKIIPGGSGIYELADLKEWQLERFLIKLSALESESDYLLIDTGAGISKNVLNFTLAADEIFIVTTPEPTSLTDAYGLIKTLNKHKFIGNIKIIVNKAVSYEEGEIAAKKLKIVVNKFLINCKLEIMGCILDDKVVQDSVKKQQPFILNYPTSKAANGIYFLASKMCNQFFVTNKAMGLKNYFTKIISYFKN